MLSRQLAFFISFCHVSYELQLENNNFVFLGGWGVKFNLGDWRGVPHISKVEKKEVLRALTVY